MQPIRPRSWRHWRIGDQTLIVRDLLEVMMKRCQSAYPVNRLA